LPYDDALQLDHDLLLPLLLLRVCRDMGMSESK
jgi:hypothetical protein